MRALDPKSGGDGVGSGAKPVTGTGRHPSAGMPQFPHSGSCFEGILIRLVTGCSRGISANPPFFTPQDVGVLIQN